MNAIIKHAAPNVVAGTNFNTQRFQELYAWIAASVADNARTLSSPYQYGLLQAFDGKTALQLEKRDHLLRLRRCTGIAPSGHIIGIYEGITPIIEENLEAYELDTKQAYYVLVEVEDSHRKPFGAVSKDLPQRPLFSMPQYSVHVQPIGQQVGKNAAVLPIGRLEFESANWQLADYIPPCVHIGANEQLLAKHKSYQEAIKIMLRAQPNIIRQTDSFRDKAMIELREFTLQCGSFLATQHHKLKIAEENGRAYDLLSIWMAYANLIDFLLHCLTDRSGFYNLLYINTRSVNGVMLTTERLDKILFDLTNIPYDHWNVLQTTDAIDRFLELIVPMFKALGNGTLRPTGNNYEEVYQAPVSEPKLSHTTW